MTSKMRFSALLATLMLFIFFFARPFLSEPTFAQMGDSHSQQEEQVFRDVAADFALYSGLIEDVQYDRDSIYPVILKAATLEEAVNWLHQGFCEDLACSLACFSLAWDEDLGKLVLIPQDSIPLLTVKDKANTVITFRNERQARLECFYYDCYAQGDCYRYTIEAEKEGKRWKICALTLDEMKKGTALEAEKVD